MPLKRSNAKERSSKNAAGLISSCGQKLSVPYNPGKNGCFFTKFD